MAQNYCGGVEGGTFGFGLLGFVGLPELGVVGDALVPWSRICPLASSVRSDPPFLCFLVFCFLALRLVVDRSAPLSPLVWAKLSGIIASPRASASAVLRIWILPISVMQDGNRRKNGNRK